MEKQCGKCKQYKSLADFSIHKGFKDDLNKKCKSCKCNEARENYKLGKTKKVKHTYHKHLRWKYKIGIDDYNIMLIAQCEQCAICKRKEKLVVDHCHNTMKIRGLLCKRCNTGLEKFEDRKELIERCLVYLNKV